jgi:hypothetical protein
VDLRGALRVALCVTGARTNGHLLSTLFVSECVFSTVDYSIRENILRTLLFKSQEEEEPKDRKVGAKKKKKVTEIT